jgi:glycosyltransferase involved in cell wall biosynthesis
MINRPAIGGPILNATLLARHLPTPFDTLLVMGACESHEAKATEFLDDLRWKQISSMRRALHPFKDITSYQVLRKIIREYRPHIVHTHTSKPGALGRLAAYAEGVPVVVHTFHGHVFHSYFNPIKSKMFQGIERFLANKSDAIITISPEQKDELVTRFKIASSDKFQIIPLGFDLNKFTTDQSTKRTKFRSELGVGEETVVIALIGRLVPIKNHGFFLESFCALKTMTKKKLLAVFVGDGESRREIEAKASKFGIAFAQLGEQNTNTELILTSWRSDIDVVNAGSDIIALSSFNEGTPVSLIEALASNRPVISTNVGGVQSVVEHEFSGFLVEKFDLFEYANYLRMLVESTELRLKMGNEGQKRIFAKYSYQRMVKETMNLYINLLSSKHIYL